jgi:TonB family protein
MKEGTMKTGTQAAIKFGAILAASLALLPAVAQADAAVGPRPQNMRTLLEIRPLVDSAGRAIGGRVGVELVVDASGRITGCSAAKSSGNANLDRHACEQVTERLTMAPATDAAGNPVEGRFRTTVAFAGGG